MKRFVALLFAFAYYAVAFSQTVIENPGYGLTSVPYVNVEKIELSDTATVLYFHTFYSPGYWISIPKKTYIQPVGGEKLFIKATEGIPINEQYTMPESGETFYKLIFPPVDRTVTRIDYGEDNEGGNWFIYDIVISERESSLVPKEIRGNWFNSQTGDWKISFLDSQAVYQSALWQYKSVNLKKGKGIIALKNTEDSVNLYVKTSKNGSLQIGLSPKATQDYVKDAASGTAMDEPYQEPLLHLDTATYCGYFKNYTPRCGVKTMTVAVNDIIAGDQNTFLAEIREDGFFSVQLPVYHPTLVYVRSKIYNGSIYIEPGRSVFQMIGAAGKKQESLFMGESGRLNSDLQKTENIFSYSYSEIQEKILDMKPEVYKEHCRNYLAEDLRQLQDIRDAGTISAKAYQVRKLNLEYSYATQIMEYNYLYESAYRKEHKISDWNTKVDVETPGLDYYDFIDIEFVNNPFAFLAGSYYIFINRLKYLEPMGMQIITHTLVDIVNELETNGYSFTDEEKSMIELMKQEDAVKQEPEQKQFVQEYETRRQNFNEKYTKLIQDFYKGLKEKKNTGPADMEAFLVENGATLTDEEKELLAAQRAYNNLESTKRLREIQMANSDAVSKFWEKHGYLTDQIALRKFKEARAEMLKSLTGDHSGLASDIMAAQDYCRGIVSEMTPVTEEAIRKMQQEIANPFIANYLAICNQRILTKIEENKRKTGFTVNEVPQTEGDRLFDAIMEKYRGKIVYVDFWATWCGPCRSGINQIKPLKEELAEKDVAFVYITNETSPANAWANMIPEIKGEHYRVTADEWNYLSSRFNISGIPHYVLVGRNGEILHSKLPHMSNEVLKRELEKQLQ